MSYKAIFLLGIPDDKMARVHGINYDGSFKYQLDGNAEFHNYLQIPPQNKTNHVIVWSDTLKKRIVRPDILINCITDPDSTGKSLQKAIIVANNIRNTDSSIAIFNDPEKVVDTTRDRIYQRFHKMPGIYVPKVIRAKPTSVKNTLEIAKENGIHSSFLMRPCGAHESQNLHRIDSKNKQLLEQYSFDGTEYYLTEFVDYKSEDGLYHKARLVFIGENICPRHYMTGESWMVHGSLHESYMAHHPETKEAELNFVNNYQKIINPVTLKTFKEIYRQTGLDYLGFDFAIRPDGSALIFEINPAQNAFMPVNFNNFPYMKDVRNNIIKALNAAVASKIKQKKQVA